jgi:RNA polymerase sigma-70 factor (ECF subfamily)
MPETSIGGANREWLTTLWTMILSTRATTPEERRRALDQLVRLYWKPVYWFVRRRGEEVESAKDLTQSFFADFLERDSLAQVSKDRGRFRSYVRASLEHFLANEFDRRAAEKRGGRTSTLSLDFAAAEAEIAREPSLPPDRAFERKWAVEVLHRALSRLEGEQHRDYPVLKAHLDLEGKASYKELAEKLGVSEGDVTNALHRARRRLMEVVADEVRGSVADARDVADEVRELFKALG